MAVLKSDITRNFGIGFMIGALIVSAISAQSWGEEFISPVQAATNEIEIKEIR